MDPTSGQVCPGDRRVPGAGRRPGRRGGLGRLLALADGVFAIALTLLVIEITLPESTSDARLGAALVALGPRYSAYVILFLMLVAFLPLPTSVLGQHGNTPTGATFYGAALVCTSAASGAPLWYASGRGRLLRRGVDHRLVRRSGTSSLTGTAYFTATLPVALVAPYLAMALWLLWFPVVRVLVTRLTCRGR